MIFWFVIFGYLLEELSQLESMNVYSCLKPFGDSCRAILSAFFFFFSLFELWLKVIITIFSVSVICRMNC